MKNATRFHKNVVLYPPTRDSKKADVGSTIYSIGIGPQYMCQSFFSVMEWKGLAKNQYMSSRKKNISVMLKIYNKLLKLNKFV